MFGYQVGPFEIIVTLSFVILFFIPSIIAFKRKRSSFPKYFLISCLLIFVSKLLIDWKGTLGAALTLLLCIISIIFTRLLLPKE